MCQVAHETLRAGVAERTGERAADLGRDAQRAAIDLRDVDALDLRALVERPRRGHPQQPLARAVLRDLLADDRGTVERVGVGQRLAQALADVRHRLEVADAAQVDPMPELPDAHPQLALGHADGGEFFFQFIPRQAGQRRFASGRAGWRLTSGGLLDRLGSHSRGRRTTTMVCDVERRRRHKKPASLVGAGPDIGALRRKRERLARYEHSLRARSSAGPKPFSE